MSFVSYTMRKRSREKEHGGVGSNIYQVFFFLLSSDSNYGRPPYIYIFVGCDTIVKLWVGQRVISIPPPSPSSVLVSDDLKFFESITNEGPLRTCSVVHPEYTIRMHVSKPLPSPNLDDRLPLCPHYPENQEKSGGALVLSMSDGMPVELCVPPLQTVVQDQASYVQDQKVST